MFGLFPGMNVKVLSLNPFPVDVVEEKKTRQKERSCDQARCCLTDSRNVSCWFPQSRTRGHHADRGLIMSSWKRVAKEKVWIRSPAACCEPSLLDLNIWEESADVCSSGSSGQTTRWSEESKQNVL